MSGARVPLAGVCAVVCGALLSLACPVARALPDGRAYELVTRYAQGGAEANVGAVYPVFTAGATDGETVDWEGFGACCGATTGAITVYQSQRGAEGWQAKVLSPTPSRPLSGLYEEQAPVFWSGDLSQTIFSTPVSYAAGDERPRGSDADDLYLQGPTGTLTWLSQGPSGGGTSAASASFDAATPDLEDVIFASAEPLTANATGLGTEPQATYLYARNVTDATTSLIDVDNSGHLISPYGARLGDDGRPKEGPINFVNGGSITHAVAKDGSKVYFETPSAGVSESIKSHLYLRDLATNTTTSLDNPASTGGAQYEGAAADGSLAFFTSDEGLDGASTEKELYEFNSTDAQIGPAAPMSSIPLAGGTGVLGVVAISNDGSHVFFIADTVLAHNVNSENQSGIAEQPNLYVYDTASGETTFIATVAEPDVGNCRPTCASATKPEGLVAEPDTFRPAAVTPNGSVFVFTSANDLTGEDHSPTTTLTEAAYAGEHRIRVASTAGFDPRHTIGVGTAGKEELEVIEKIDSPTELTFEEYGPGVVNGFAEGHPQGAEVSEINAEIYRYVTTDETLTCVSCTPPGVFSSGSASFGETGLGSYAPGGQLAPMSEDGSRIFFDSPDPLAPGAGGAQVNRLFEPTDVYEWENGTVSLIADGTESEADLNGTTPSGNDVFFSVGASLTRGAVMGYRHIYDARVDGGFPEPPPPPGEPCAVEACRTEGAPSEFFPLPASALLDEAGAESSPPRFSVSKITATQRTALVRTGRLALRISANTPGELAASATTRLHGKNDRVAHSTAAVRNGPTMLTLTLDKAARMALAETHVLALRIEVDYTAGNATEVAELELTARAKRPHGGSHAGA